MEELNDLIKKWRDEAQRREKFRQDESMRVCINVLNQCAKELEDVVKEMAEF